MKRLLAAALLIALSVPAVAEPEVYLEAAFGLTRQGPDLSGTLDGQRNLGKVVLGVEYKNLFIEAEHISDVQSRDTGMDTLWTGIRLKW